jgi:flagellar biosynthetic protein FliR
MAPGEGFLAVSGAGALGAGGPLVATPFVAWALSSLLLSMRIAPVLGFAPPFTLTKSPASVRLLVGLGLAGLIIAGRPEVAAGAGTAASGWLVAAAARELLVGLTFVMALQLMFGAIYLAGRTVDVQAGFGLAGLIDPTSNAQVPLIGTLIAYAAGAVFFAMGGHLDLMRLLAASVDAVPIGLAAPPASLEPLMAFLGAVMTIAFGVAGGAILALFLTDLVIALLSRTVPQMNVLMLGLQVKSILVLLVLPISAGVWGALLTRLARVTLEALPGLLSRGAPA